LPSNRGPDFINETIAGCTPGFALGSLMISASQSQARAIEASVNSLISSNTATLATTAQTVVRILGAPATVNEEVMAALMAKILT
jgi:hypothetical protein